jgi:hypothetical protein
VVGPKQAHGKTLDLSRKHSHFGKVRVTPKSTRSNDQKVKEEKKMSDDEMMQVDDEDVMPIRSKGKGKAVENVDGEDNLPW